MERTLILKAIYKDSKIENGKPLNAFTGLPESLIGYKDSMKEYLILEIKRNLFKLGIEHIKEEEIEITEEWKDA